MQNIVLDAELTAKLNGLNRRVEVRDETGAIVGVYLPVEQYRSLVEHLDVPYTDEELEQFFNSEGSGSLAEFWKQMGTA